MIIAKAEQRADFHTALAAEGRAAEIPEAADVYGWLCGSWDLVVLRYRGVDVSTQRLTGEMHAGRVLEGRAVQDVWIMPARDDRTSTSDPTMNMYGTTLRSWDASIQAWRIAWTNPVRGHREEQIGNWNSTESFCRDEVGFVTTICAPYTVWTTNSPVTNLSYFSPVSRRTMLRMAALASRVVASIPTVCPAAASSAQACLAPT